MERFVRFSSFLRRSVRACTVSAVKFWLRKLNNENQENVTGKIESRDIGEKCIERDLNLINPMLQLQKEEDWKE